MKNPLKQNLFSIVCYSFFFDRILSATLLPGSTNQGETYRRLAEIINTAEVAIKEANSIVLFHCAPRWIWKELNPTNSFVPSAVLVWNDAQLPDRKSVV